MTSVPKIFRDLIIVGCRSFFFSQLLFWLLLIVRIFVRISIIIAKIGIAIYYSFSPIYFNLFNSFYSNSYSEAVSLNINLQALTSEMIM